LLFQNGMGLAKCTASFFLGTASTIFLLIGITTVAAFTASLVTFVRALVPNYIAIAGIGAGVAIIIIAVCGFVSACSKRHKRISLSCFMIFDFLVFVLVAVTAFFMLRSNDAIKALNKVHFTNVTEGFEQGIGTMITNGVDTTYKACEADVHRLPKIGGYFTMSCNQTEWNVFADIINGNCLGPDHAVEQFTAVTTTTFTKCFDDQTFWTSADNGYTGPVVWLALGRIIDTPKGVFCQCYDKLSDVITSYFTVIAYSSIGVAVFFGIVFLACCYLCCCYKPLPEEDQSSALRYNTGAYGGNANKTYVARP